MKLVIFFTCLFLNLRTVAQSVSIEFSIELKTLERNICESHKLYTVPYLNLSYKNNTSDSLYFFKITDKFYFPATRINCFGSKKKISCLDDLQYHPKDKYKVIIGGTTFNSYPEIFDIDADEHAEHEGNIINDEVQDIYTYILHDTVAKKSFYT